MTRVEISSTTDFRELAVRLRLAEKEFQHEMGRAIEKTAHPLPRRAKESALRNLPHHGGLNRVVAGSSIEARRLSDSEVEIVARGIPQLAAINDGMVTHPVYGHRWRSHQLIPKARGWFTNPMERSKHEFADELGDAMHRVAKNIT